MTNGQAAPARPASDEASFRIRAGFAIVGRALEVRKNVDLLIQDGLIAAIEPSAAFDLSDPCTILDVPDAIVLPGLVDTHRHLWQTPLRGLGADLIGPQYRRDLRKAVAPHFTPQDVYAATLAGAVEALDCGITTILDWAHIMNSPEHADASIAALRESGLRAVFAPGAPNGHDSDLWWSDSALPHPHDVHRIRAALPDDDAALVTMAFAARAPHLVRREVMLHDWALARDLGLKIVVDGGLGGGLWGPRTHPIRMLAAEGLLGDDTVYIHCNNLESDEYELIAASGGSVSISPCSEIHVGFGAPASGALLAHGIRPALSVDYVTSIAGDMFNTMRSVLATERALIGRDAFAAGHGVPPWTLKTRDVLEFATVQGAQALGMSGRTGSIEVGKSADLLLLNTASLRLSPVNDPVATAVLLASPADVDTVIVNGRILKQSGKLLRNDTDELRRDVVASRDALLKSAGLVHA